MTKIQSNLFNTDIKGTEPSCPLYRGVRIIEVGNVWFLAFLGPNKLSAIERCLYYRGVCKERLDCTWHQTMHLILEILVKIIYCLSQNTKQVELFSGYFLAKRTTSEKTIRKLFWLKSVPGAKLQLLNFGGKGVNFQDVWFEMRHCLLYFYVLLLLLPTFFHFSTLFVSYFCWAFTRLHFRGKSFPEDHEITFKEVSHRWVVGQNIHHSSFLVFLACFSISESYWCGYGLKDLFALHKLENILTHARQIKILPRVNIFHKTRN